MKLRTRILAFLMTALLALPLAACGSEDTTTEPNVSEVPSAPTVDLTAADPCLATAGIPGDTVLFTVNGTPLTAREYLFWLAYSVTSKENSVLSYGGSGIDWSAKFNGTLSQSDYLKQEARSSAMYWHMVKTLAQENGCTLTEEEAAVLGAYMDAMKTQVGGQDVFDSYLRRNCMDEELLYDLNAIPVLSTKVADAIYADQPTAEELDAYIAANDLLRAKHILLTTVDSTTGAPLDDAVIAEKYATAQDLLTQLQTSQEPLVLFDELMHQHSEDPGLATAPDGYLFTANQMVAPFEQTTRELEFDQISGIVETSFGYHIILRLSPDTPDVRQSCRTALLDADLNTQIAEADVIFTDEYNAIDAQTFFDNLKALAAQE